MRASLQLAQCSAGCLPREEACGAASGKGGKQSAEVLTLPVHLQTLTLLSTV